MKFAVIVLSTIILFASCGGNNDQEDKVKEIDKTGAVESIITIAHLNDSIDVLTTSHLVWKNNAQVKTIVKKDTIPSLGKMIVQDDKNNNTVINKDYEIYITIKE